MSNAHLISHITILVVLNSPLIVLSQQHGTQPTSMAHSVLEDKKEGEAMAEDVIRQRVEDYSKAVSSRNINRVMSLYAPNVASFDLNPPLRYAGAENKRRAWQEFFAAYTGPVVYEVHDLSVMADGDLAFADSLNHVKGAQANGHTTDLWVRWTACFRRIDGVWMVVHDHVSVPVDLAHGKAALNLTP